MNNYIIKVHILVENELLPTLRSFTENYGKRGSSIRPVAKTDADQVLVEFSISTPDAAVWLYGWIHKYKFDGDVNKTRDAELEWITGSTDFRDLIYAILYKNQYSPAGEISTLKFATGEPNA